MKAGSPVRIIGLTGGIASGKSLVAGILREFGARVIDADLVARDVVAPGGEALGEIVAAFGAGILAADGALDRKAMADRVFADSDARARLNAIVHPRVRDRIAEEIAAIRERAPGALIVVDIPLLLDATTDDAYPLDGIVVVFADEAAQLARMRHRDGLSEEAARGRLRAQRPLREKVRLATWMIDNTGTPEETRRQVEALWRAWREEA